MRLGHAQHTRHNDAKLGAGSTTATAGAVGVLHTHNRRLDFHPHVHRVVPAAALDAKQGVWRTKARPTRPRRGKASATKTGATPAGGGGYLLSQTALAKVFRAKLLDAIRNAGLSLPPSLPTLWVAHCKAVGDGQKALLYLGRYLYRGVIQEADILRCDDRGKVTFQYRDAKTDKLAQRTLPGADFLWLVLQLVLPRGLRRSRSFGFLHPNSAGAIRLLLQVLHLRVPHLQPRSARARSRGLAMRLRPTHAGGATANAGVAGCGRAEPLVREFAACAGQAARQARHRQGPHDALSPPSPSPATL